MRIKFLSFIASFFIVSFVITSCLDDDNNIEYSPDATIHAFELDTIGYGKTYKFTIDQLKGEIYNEDSLPVGADTIIDRILIRTLSTVSGTVTILDKEGKNDSIALNTSDSIDLRNPLKIRVYSTEAFANYPLDMSKTKVYTVSVRVHQQDPDSMQWMKMSPIEKTTEEQKVLLVGNKILVYRQDHTIVGTIDEKTSEVSWKEAPLTADRFSELPTSMVKGGTKFYATFKNEEMKRSADGLRWIKEDKWGNEVKLLLAGFSHSLLAIRPQAQGDFRNDFFCTLPIDTPYKPEELEVPVPHGKFPTDHIVSAVYTNSNGVESAILVGNSAEKYTVPWTTTETDKEGWAPMRTAAGSETSYPSCPKIENPSIIHYNNAFYIFGGDFSTVYKSLNGLAWNVADKKFWIPEEFPNKEKEKYSLVVDENNFIWIIWNKGDVWRGRLNKLGFDKK